MTQALISETVLKDLHQAFEDCKPISMKAAVRYSVLRSASKYKTDIDKWPTKDFLDKVGNHVLRIRDAIDQAQTKCKTTNVADLARLRALDQSETEGGKTSAPK